MSHHIQQRSTAAQFYMEVGDEDPLLEFGGLPPRGHPGGHHHHEGGYGGAGTGGVGIGGPRRGSSTSYGGPGGSGSSGVGGGGGGLMMGHGFPSEPNDYQDETEVAELLTKAAVTSNDEVKLENLRRVKDIIVKKQPTLLDNFLDEMLNFQSDSQPEVRRYILEFIEEACKTDPETIPKILHNMLLMLSDSVVSVQKKAIQVMAKVYRYTLIWLCRSKIITEEMESAWASVNELKLFIVQQIDSDNDGIRTHTVKFIETVILLQTSSESDSIKRENEFCLDQVPSMIKVARPRKLEEDARNLFDELLKFHGSRHATSVNLMTCMGSLVIIAKLRPSLMGRVISALEKLNAILPPTLERSQVKSVRKHMKAQLIGLLKHSRAVDYYDNITTLLTDLGATHHELNKAIPNWDQIRSEKRKRQRALQEMEEMAKRKRARMEIQKDEPSLPLEEDSSSSDEDEVVLKPLEDPRKRDKDDGKDLDEIEKFVLGKLSPEMATELVMASMDKLPNKMPAHFMSSYTPVAIAGTDSQVRHVARLLAAQITAYEAALKDEAKKDEDYIEEAPIPTLVNQLATPVESKESKGLLELSKGKLLMGVGVPGKKKIKAVKLSEVTKPLSPEAKEIQVFNGVKRILYSSEGMDEAKCKLLASILTTSPFKIRHFVMQFIKQDMKKRFPLGMAWVIGEYAMGKGIFEKGVLIARDSPADRYDWTFYNLMKAIIESCPDNEKANLAWELYMEPPVIPDRGLDLLKQLCSFPNQSKKCLELLAELIFSNKSGKLYYLSALLEFCVHSWEETRQAAASCVMKVYEAGIGVRAIEDMAMNIYLLSVKSPNPPEMFFTEQLGRFVTSTEWTEELVRSAVLLYMQLLCVNPSLIHELPKVYVATTPDVKRGILRCIEAPIRKMGMESPHIMKLLDTFPKGAETLMTRIIHILTDKTLPSTELVSKVRGLYAKRVSDVRFLIPVLNGLTKAEIVAALPKLIKLNPNVVKEVFNRLLGIHADSNTQHTSPISPVELLVTLHNIEPSRCDVKTVIKATSLCFNETDVYTAEVLAVVINQLLEQNPLPTLLMRTVIQTLALHSKLSGFILNTLGRLVQKQVWTQPKVWEGFIKCCQRTIPKSTPILLTLPPPQLRQVIRDAPDIHGPLYSQIMSLTPQQRACMPSALLGVILGGNEVKSEVEVIKIEDYYEGGMSENGGRNVKREPRSPNHGQGEHDFMFKDEPIDYYDEGLH